MGAWIFVKCVLLVNKSADEFDRNIEKNKNIILFEVNSFERYRVASVLSRKLK